MRKRILAVVIVIIMLIALVPTAALAHSGNRSSHNHSNSIQYIEVRIDAGSNGTVYSPSSQSYPRQGNTWWFRAVPNAGYKFSHWTYTGNEMPGAFSTSEVGGSRLAVNISQKGRWVNGYLDTSSWPWKWVSGYSDYMKYKAQAVFVVDDTVYDVTLDLGSGGTFDSNSSGSIVVSGKKGDSFVVPAYSLNTGYDHIGWSSALNFDSTKTVNAKYEYLVTFVPSAHMTITGSNPVWTSGHSVSAPSVSVDSGYRSDGWNRSLSGFSAPTTVTANPCIMQATVSVSAGSDGWLEKPSNVNGVYDVGATVNLNNADPEHDYNFLGWRDDSNGQMLTNATVTINGDCSYTAIFGVYLGASAGDNGSIGNYLDGYYERGSKVNLNDTNPTGDTGYELRFWREFDGTQWQEYSGFGAEVELTGGEPIVTIGSQNFFRAFFKLKDYTVTFEDSQGETLGTETVQHGKNITKTKDSFTYDTGERPVGNGFGESEGQNITGNKTITVVTEYKATIDIGSGALDSGSLTQWVAYNGNAAEPSVTPPTGHHWDSPMWDVSFTGITAATTITAQYVINTYTVSFVDQNGAPFSTPQTIAYGSDAAKPALDDAINTQYDASMTAWEAELIGITASVQITVALDYLVTFDPDTGTSTDPNVSQFVAWGDDATEPVVTPPTGYHWDTPAWDNPFTNVTAPVQTQAQYEINVYTVTFKDSQGDTLGTEDVAHGSDVTKVAADFTYDAGERPVGDGWAAVEGQNITAAKTIVVNTEYEVTFDENGGTVNSGDLVQWIAYGADAAEPDVSPPDGYHWDSPTWDTVFTNVTATLTTIAQYEINTYQVTFIDQNGDAYSVAQTIDHGKDAAKPALDDPIGSQYDAAITAWESELLNVTEDRVVTVALEYQVTFDVTPGSSSDANVSQFVAWGADAIAPAVSPPAGHHVDNPAWDTPITSIIEPTATKARYQINVYTVSFYDFDDTLLGTDRVAWGNAAEPPVIPEREGHTFMDWSDSIDPITSTLSVTAEYKINTYTVEFVDFDGAAIGASQTVDWNTAASAPANPERDGYDFSEWDKAFDHVKANLTITAVYTEVVVEPEPRVAPTTQPAAVEPETETLGDDAVPQAQWWSQGGAFPWWWILVIFGGLVGLFLMWWFLIWKRRNSEEA